MSPDVHQDRKALGLFNINQDTPFPTALWVMTESRLWDTPEDHSKVITAATGDRGE